jgi:hypothetical protein
VAESLKLKAIDADDFAVVAACLQDALVPAHDMCFIPEDASFVMVANRFRWERLLGQSTAYAAEEAELPPSDPGGPAFERTHCAISFSNVSRVRSRGFTPGRENQGRLLELLTIHPEDGAVTVVFAGGAAVRLEGAGIDALIQDVGEPWPTLWRPRHPGDEEVDREGGTR